MAVFFFKGDDWLDCVGDASGVDCLGRFDGVSCDDLCRIGVIVIEDFERTGGDSKEIGSFNGDSFPIQNI